MSLYQRNENQIRNFLNENGLDTAKKKETEWGDDDENAIDVFAVFRARQHSRMQEKHLQRRPSRVVFCGFN